VIGLPLHEKYSSQMEAADQSIRDAIRAAQKAYVALEKAKASQIAYEIQHAEMEYQKAMKQLQAAQQHLPYVSAVQQMHFTQAQQMLQENAPQLP